MKMRRKRAFKEITALVMLVTAVLVFNSSTHTVAGDTEEKIPVDMRVYYEAGSKDRETVFVTGNSVIFHVEVVDITTGEAVTTGTVSITNITGITVPFSGTASLSLSNRVAVFNFTVLAGDTGCHAFLLTYTDSSGVYRDSNATTRAFFNYDYLHGYHVILTVLNEPGTVVMGEEVVVTSVIEFADSSYMLLKEDNFLFYLVYTCGNDRYVGATSTYTASYARTMEFNLTLAVPMFTGLNESLVSVAFSGSTYTFADPASKTFAVTVVDPGTAVTMTISNDSSSSGTVERSGLTEYGNGFTVNCEISSFDYSYLVAGFELLSNSGEHQGWLGENIVVTDRFFNCTVELSARDFPVEMLNLGEHSIRCHLADSSGETLVESNTTLLLVDDAVIDELVVDKTLYSPGETLDARFFTRGEDFSEPLAVPFTITLENSSTQGTTDEYGYGQGSVAVPDAPGEYLLEISTSIDSNSTFYRNAIATVTITVSTGSKIIILSGQGEDVTRGESITLAALVSGDDGSAVSSGDFSLVHGESSGFYSLLTTGHPPSCSFNWLVPDSFPVGAQVFTWIFSNSSIHRANSFSFTLNVRSRPLIAGFSCSNNSLKAGEMVTISGRLVDEVNEPLSGFNITITVYNSSSSLPEECWTVITGDDGFFHLDYSTSSPGTRYFEAFYTPDGSSSFYLASSTVSLVVNAWSPLEIAVDGDLVAGERAYMTITGSDGELVDLVYYYLGEMSVIASNIQLDNNGYHAATWEVPSTLAGPVSIAVIDVLDGENHAGLIATVFNRPFISVDIPVSVLAGHAITFTVNSTTAFNVTVDGKVIYQSLPPGILTREYTFHSTGNHVIAVTATGEWVLPLTVEKTTAVSLELLVNITGGPTSVVNDSYITITVTDANNLAIPGAIAAIYRVVPANDLLLAQNDVSGGITSLFLPLEVGIHFLRVEITVPSSDYQHWSRDLELTVLELPVIAVLEPAIRAAGEGLAFTASICTARGATRYLTVEFSVFDSSNQLLHANHCFTDDDGLARYIPAISIAPGNYWLLVRVDENTSTFTCDNAFFHAFTVVEGTLPVIASKEIIPLPGNGFTVTVSVTHCRELATVEMVTESSDEGDRRVFQLEFATVSGNTSTWTVDFTLDAGIYWLSFTITDNLGLIARSVPYSLPVSPVYSSTSIASEPPTGSSGAVHGQAINIDGGSIVLTAIIIISGSAAIIVVRRHLPGLSDLLGFR